MAGSLVIVISNAIIRGIIDGMSDFLRLPDVTSILAVKVKQNFYAQFINTGLIILFLEASFQLNLFSFINSEKEGGLHSLIMEIFSGKIDVKGNYYDYNKEWFDVLGIKIALTMIFYIITPIILFLSTPVIACLKMCLARCKFLQVDMNKTLVGTPLDVTKVYSLTMTQIFITMTYFSGMPILVWITCITMFV